MILSLTITLLYVITTVGGLILLKKGSIKAASLHKTKNKKLTDKLNFILVTGVVFYIASFLFYTYLISKYDLGVIIPTAAALVYLVLFVSSYFVFKEKFTKRKIVAITLIVVGVILMGVHTS